MSLIYDFYFRVDFHKEDLKISGLLLKLPFPYTVPKRVFLMYSVTHLFCFHVIMNWHIFSLVTLMYPIRH